MGGGNGFPVYKGDVLREFVHISLPYHPMSSKLRLYYELSRLHLFPLGTDTMFWPFGWGVLLSAYSSDMPSPHLSWQLLMFGFTSMAIHSGACVVNDMLDRDFDRKVERSKNRPLASGKVSMAEASVLLFFWTTVMIWSLSFAGQKAFLIGLVGIPTLCTIYPLMKRLIDWPSVFLGLASSLGIPIGWAAMTGRFDWHVIAPCVIAHTCWMTIYDTIYGCQDMRDDTKAGVRSVAIRLGEKLRHGLSVVIAIFCLTMAYAGFMNGQFLSFYVMGVAAPTLLSLWYVWTFNPHDPEDCRKKFIAHRHGATLVCAGIAIDYYLKFAKISS